MRRKLAAGNWKMNGTGASLAELRALADAVTTVSGTDILVCPPATLLNLAVEAIAGKGIAIGAQDCHAEASGAFTGDVSAAMIADTGASYVIVGHSERRDVHHETSDDVRAKAQAAMGAGVTPIICIGESEAQRVSGDTLAVLGAQLEASCPDSASATEVVTAYEPIWAIGTGRVPTLEQIAEVHDFLRARLVERFGDNGNTIRLLYGGSVKASNAAEIFTCANVDGALVGGASLKAVDFAPIVQALQES